MKTLINITLSSCLSHGAYIVIVHACYIQLFVTVILNWKQDESRDETNKYSRQPYHTFRVQYCGPHNAETYTLLIQCMTKHTNRNLSKDMRFDIYELVSYILLWTVKQHGPRNSKCYPSSVPRLFITQLNITHSYCEKPAFQGSVLSDEYFYGKEH